MKLILRLLAAISLTSLIFLSSPPACASSAVVNLSQKVTLSYTASGTQPFTQKWMKDGTPIAGATAPTFVIPAFAAADSGDYQVVVTNSAGSTTSDHAVLTQVVVAPGNVVTGIQVVYNGATKFYPLGNSTININLGDFKTPRV